MTSQSRIRGLDELRGIAILAVVVGHGLAAILPSVTEMRPRWVLVGAIAAVDLFFVISGFLITAILLRSDGSPGAAASFYARRAKRILPLAVVVIAYSYWRFPGTRDLVWPYVLFWNNYHQFWMDGRAMTGLGPMWSLAVEEQFYLVWPLLVWLVPRRWLWVPILMVAIFFIAYPISQGPALVSITDGLYLSDGRTHIRGLGIVLGAGLALWRAGLLPKPPLVVAGLIASAIAASLVWGRVAGLLTLPVATTFTVLVGLAVSDTWALRCRPLAWIGVRCYGLYLFHGLILAEIAFLLPTVGAAGYLAIYLSSALVLAAVSFRWFESPILRWSAHRAAPPSVSPPATSAASA